MTRPFDCFVMFAEMRTGSNLLESHLNAMAGVTCHGEAFNPHFIGHPKQTELLGLSRAERDADPLRLLSAIRTQADSLGGFRFFHDHDPRVLDAVLDDPRCAKIILTRNPLESYVSKKIAQATGQWKLTNVKSRRDAAITFDADEFERHVTCLQGFQLTLGNRLRTTGQTAFHLTYEDLSSLEVMNGLARYLGSKARLTALDGSLKVQNPDPLEAKVANFDEMRQALARRDPFGATQPPDFEPRRGAAVPGFVCAARAPLLYMPIRSGPEADLRAWLAALDDVPEDALRTQMNQAALRDWMRATPGQRRFTVLRHPVARAHAAFCNKILIPGPACYGSIRRTLRNFHKLPLPRTLPDESYDLAAHRAAFLAFLKFLKANLAGQTAIRVDPHWCSQAAAIEGMAQFGAPDVILREDELPDDLPALARKVGYTTGPPAPVPSRDQPFSLAHVYDATIETLTRKIYWRDYRLFGFCDWA